MYVLSDAHISVRKQLESANEDQIGQILFIRRKQGDLWHALAPIPPYERLLGFEVWRV